MAFSFAGNFEEGMSAYNAGDYKKGQLLLMEAAKQNNAGAQFTLGAIYGNDIGVVQSNIFAYALFGLASKNGNQRGKEMQSRVVDWLTLNDIKTAQSLVDNPKKLWVEIEKIESKKKK
jgi:TPR repeat protein